MRSQHLEMVTVAKGKQIVLVVWADDVFANASLSRC